MFLLFKGIYFFNKSEVGSPKVGRFNEKWNNDFTLNPKPFTFYLSSNTSSLAKPLPIK